MVRGCLCGWVGGWKCVCVCVSDPSFIQFALGSCCAVQINALSIELLIKVYIERRNMQVELIRFRKKKPLFTFTFVK